MFWDLDYLLLYSMSIRLREEYTTLLRCPKVQVRKAYAKGDGKCIPWENLRDLVLTHPDERNRVAIFALSIYGLVIFPKALRHVDEVVTDLFDHLEKGITPIPAILAEVFRSLSMCRKIGDHYKKKVRELSDAWKQICWMKRLAVGSIMTPEYNGWFRKRINDNIPRPSLEDTGPVEEQLQVA
ncbi:hypothetical protein PVK06_008035 [Gossypium arboreum]|uniref:DUF7745 domain-containing protein n=1 Tax=Gossypium arboreum TaxID=29729 RepID=A0ABR0QIX1_GOSAR|nr:hypothetical protein PVK06_008035 [Gossypium arboreum]